QACGGGSHRDVGGIVTSLGVRIRSSAAHGRERPVGAERGAQAHRSQRRRRGRTSIVGKVNSSASGVSEGELGAPRRPSAPKLVVVDLLVVAVLTGVVVLGLGTAGSLASRMTERSPNDAALNSVNVL